MTFCRRGEKATIACYDLYNNGTVRNMLYQRVIVNPYSAGIDFSRQNLTTKVDPRTVRIKIFIMAVDP